MKLADLYYIEEGAHETQGTCVANALCVMPNCMPQLLSLQDLGMTEWSITELGARIFCIAIICICREAVSRCESSRQNDSSEVE